MVTASPSTVNKVLALEAGVNKFLCKPVREQLLYEEIGELIPVNYSYTQNNNLKNLADNPVNATRIQSLPLSIRLELKDAIKSGYIDNINHWIEQTESYDTEIANTLRYMSEKYDYISMLHILNTSG